MPDDSAPAVHGAVAADASGTVEGAMDAATTALCTAGLSPQAAGTFTRIVLAAAIPVIGAGYVAESKAAVTEALQHVSEGMAKQVEDTLRPVYADVARLRELATTILSQFTERGHPGRECRRTGWVDVDMIATWRQQVEPKPPTGDRT